MHQFANYLQYLKTFFRGMRFKMQQLSPIDWLRSSFSKIKDNAARSRNYTNAERKTYASRILCIKL